MFELNNEAQCAWPTVESSQHRQTGWRQTRPDDWHVAWHDVDPGITSHDMFSKIFEISKVVKMLPVEYREPIKKAAFHLLKMCFKDSRCPTMVRPTASGGIVFYWYPIPSNVTVYTCLEIFEDGEVVAAWSDGLYDDAVELGVMPGASEVAAAMETLDAALPLKR